MTTHRTYSCNICGDRINSRHSNGLKDGFGLYYTVGAGYSMKPVSECERHICHQCAKNVHDELRKIMPAAQPHPEKQGD